jgi:tRNA uridine 5-carboxymethylaminomethyl modification enzyme
MPLEVQYELCRTIVGLENVEIMRPGYAVEYDFLDPIQLSITLESKFINNLFFAGQINGTTGYEEAGSQGLVAGVNAALKVKGEPPFILDRSKAYMGILIDDLVTKGVDEPYRMFTSRAEYRLILREDNADLRLREIGYRLGLVGQEEYDKYMKKKESIEKEFERLENKKILPTPEMNEILTNLSTAKMKKPQSLKEILRRPEISYSQLCFIDKESAGILGSEIAKQVEMEVKYEGYIKRQMEQIEKFKKLESIQIPEEFYYEDIPGLSREIVEKLTSIRPDSLGQATRISGITPAAISVLMVYMKKFEGTAEYSK